MVLAIRIVKISILQQQHASLPPTAFARIIAWSHGQVSADTTSLSKRGHAKPVFLPIGAAAEAVTELEISLWDKRQTGNTGAESTAVLLDVGAEVILPATNELGDSEQEAIEKTFPLEAQSRGVGTITLRAWQATPGKAWKVLAKDPAHSTYTATTDIGSNPGCQTTSGSDTDEKLFFELSESSGSNGDTPVVEKAHSIGETSVGSASTEDVATGEQLEAQHEIVPDLHRERPSNESGPTEPPPDFELATERPDKELTLTTPRNNRRASTQQNAATGSSADPPGSSLFDRGAALPSFHGAHNAGNEISRSEATEKDAETQPQSLDLVSAMLPLIPSFLEGSAEVRVRVRGIRIPCTGHNLATPPYVRASLYPGAHSIARTGLPSVGPALSANTPSSVSSREGGTPLVESAPPKGVVDYLFGGTDCSANGNEHTISLPLGSRDVEIASNENVGSSPPRIRLEVVSGRSLGWCDLALPEALRRPGSVARKLRVPVWRKRWARRQAKNDGERSMPRGAKPSTPGCLASHQDTRFVGEIILDLGVMLSGEPWPSPSEAERGALELTSGSIHVETAKFCIRDTEGGGVALSAVQRTMFFGVSSRLTLGEGEPKLSAFDAGGHGNRWAAESKSGCSTAQDDAAGHDGKVTLVTSCAELDILVLRLVQRDGGDKIVSGSGLGVEQRQGRGGDALMIAVSDINDVFDGRWQWVKMRHDYAGEALDRQKGVHPSGGKAGVLGRRQADAGRQLEVLLRISVANIAPIRPHEHHRTSDTVGRSSAKGLLPQHKSDYLSSDRVTNERFRVAEPPPSGGAPRSALEAWITSPGNIRSQAIAAVPPQDTGRCGLATTHPKDGATVAERVLNTAGCPSQACPGVLELEVLAIHGKEQGLWPATNHDRDSYDGGGDSSAPSSSHSPPWWVRVTCSNGGGGACGRGDVSSIDSLAGKVSLHERSQDRRGGAGAVASPPLRQDDAEGLGCDWTVRWPPHGGVLAKYPVHWTPSQSVIPVVSFEVFRGQTLTARSMLEIPPMIKHQGRHLAFSHPCLRTSPPKNGSLKPSSSKDSNANVLLDLRCSFNTDKNGGKRNRQHLDVGDARARAPGVHRPPSETKLLQGGVLCIQVVATQRVHRSVRSALARPCSVVISLPHHHTESMSVGWNNPSYGGGGGWAGCPEDRNQNKEGSKRWSDGEEDIAVLRVEPRKHASVVALVALCGENGGDSQAGAFDSLGDRDAHAPTSSESVLGVTWLPISDNVMERGHLEDGWYPLRVVGRGWNIAPKACDMRLRFHFIPELQHPSAGLSSEEQSGRPNTEFGNPSAEFLTVVLEEGRHLNHPELRVGPLELFGEITVDYQLGNMPEDETSCGIGGHRPNSQAVRSKRVVGPLPLREGTRPQEGRASHLAARRLGNGASPCWQHVMRIPIPAAKAMAENKQGAGSEFCNRAPDLTPGVTGRGLGESFPPTAMLSVAIKSAAMRVVTRNPSPVPRRLLTSYSDGHAQRPEERVTERCLLLGVARIRLPSDMLRHHPRQRDGAPVRGWYTVKDEASGVHRGKVKLSIFPADTSTGCARHDGSGLANDSSNTCTDSNRRHRSDTSSSSKEPRFTGSRGRPHRGSGNTGGNTTRGYVSDSSKQSKETDAAVVALRRTGGYDLPDGMQGAGLLFVSIGDVVVRSCGKAMRQLPATLVGASVSVRNRHRYRNPDEGRPHRLAEARMDGHNPSGGGDSGYTHASSSSELDSREFGAVLAVDRYGRADDYSTLYVQANVKTPHRPVGTAYHGVASLTPCLSSAGIAVQERKGLMKMERQRGEVSRTSANVDGIPVLGGNYSGDDENGSIETPMTASGSDEGGGDADGPAWAKRKTEKTAGCCSVNVTTSFLPHVRGVVEVDPIQLSLTPPNRSDLERWRDLSELRERTEPEGVGENSQKGRAEGPTPNDFGKGGVRAVCSTATITAFLRFRILPAGPWKFSRTFPLKLPRPADWGRDPSCAGTSHLQGGARAFLELNTAVHAIAREQEETNPSSLVPPRAAGAADSHRQNYGVYQQLEPLTLEVCLFDNDRPSSSPLAPPSSSALLGLGTIALPPIIASRLQQGDNRGNSIREVILLEPGSGKSVASALLGITFSSHNGSYLPPTESPRIAGAAKSYSERLPKISEVSEAIWALKAAFYAIDNGNVHLVPVEDILTALSDARWPRGASASNLPHLRQITDNVGVGPGAAPVAPDSVTHASEEAETLLNRLRRLGVGVRDGGGECDNADTQDGGGAADLVHYIRHLLAPPDSKGDGELVSWEVWAALSELIVCRSNHGDGRENPALVPPATAACVWRRAEEIRCAENTTDSEVDGISREGCPDLPRVGDLGDLETLSVAGLGGFSGGHGDISFWADDYSSAEQNPREKSGTAVGTGSDSGTRRNPRRQTAPSSMPVRGRPNSAPSTGSASKGRLHQTLATSRRSWSLRSTSQRQLRRGQGQGSTRSNSRGLRRSSSSPSNRHRKVTSAATRRNETLHSRRFSEREYALGPFETPTLRPRPTTAPAVPAAGRSATKGRNTLTPPCPNTGARPASARQGPRQLVHETARMRSVGGGPQPHLGNSTGFMSHTSLVGEWGGAVAGDGESEFEWRGEGAARDDDDMENGHLRTETASAKRKAAQYQTCMLEAQRALGNEHQRMLALEERALGAEGLLLQRDRNRIREEARARTRFMQVQVEIARRNERVASKNNRAKVEAAAATRLQWIAKGYIERCRFKAEIRSIKALQRGGRSVLQARRRRCFRVRQTLAALLLQRVWRGRSTRKRLAAREVRVTFVQAIVRGRLQRERISHELQAHLRYRNEAATVLQKNRRRAAARRIFLALRGASVKVQSNHRRWRARRSLEQRRLSVRVLQRAARHFVFNRFRAKAATLLQKSYCLRMRMKHCRRQRKAILDAAGVIQQFVRAWVARRAVSRRREKRRADRSAATIQRAMWRHLCRRKEHRRKVAAALTLLKFMGGLSVKLAQMRKRRTSSAATRIQSAFRMRRSRVQLGALRAKRRGIVAASKIQAIARGHRSRVDARALLAKRRKESAACTKIQAAYRGHVAYVNSRVLLLQRREGSAATSIQAWFHGHRSRVETRTLRAKQRAAATRIQSLFLHHRRRKRIDALRRERERSALIVQRAWRKSKTSGDAKLVQKDSTSLGMDNVKRGSAHATWASSKTRRDLDCAAFDCTTLQLVLEALARGVVSCGSRTPSDTRQLHEELVLREDDPILEASLCHRLSRLETAMTSSSKFEDKPTEIPAVQARKGQKALQALKVLEAGLLRPSE